MTSFQGKTVIITGASRGIGRSIALELAKAKANVVIAAKTVEPHKTLPGTIYTVAEEVEKAGGKALAFQLDVRDAEQITEMVKACVERFSGIDALVNNAGAIRLTGTSETPAKAFDLMMDVNARATFLCSQACLPYLEKAANPHILNLSPPIKLNPRWLQNHVAYTMSKYGMSLCTIGMAAEFAAKGVSINSLWPKSIVATAAVTWLMGEDVTKHCRKPEMMAKAAFEILSTEKNALTGNTLVDEDFLKTRGMTDFSLFACDPSAELYADLYIDAAS
jgi:citronellol/citronellal dehydrogenase